VTDLGDIYCLFWTCKKAMRDDCPNPTAKVAVEDFTLPEMENRYPTYNFCQAWEQNDEEEDECIEEKPTGIKETSSKVSVRVKMS